MLFFVILVQFFTGASALLANARMTFAFARDEALPLSNIWSKINNVTGTPVNAVWFVVLFCGCLNLIGIGSSQTITAIFNLCAPCLDLSYIAVLLAHQIYANKVRFIEGPFSLGKWSKPLNFLAISWVVFISVVLFCPTSNPVTPTNMNYAIVVAGFVALFSLSWWWAGARKKYTGPRTQDIMDRNCSLPALLLERRRAACGGCGIRLEEARRRRPGKGTNAWLVPACRPG